jgi:hypothetical protein
LQTGDRAVTKNKLIKLMVETKFLMISVTKKSKKLSALLARRGTQVIVV